MSSDLDYSSLFLSLVARLLRRSEPRDIAYIVAIEAGIKDGDLVDLTAFLTLTSMTILTIDQRPRTCQLFATVLRIKLSSSPS